MTERLSFSDVLARCSVAKHKSPSVDGVHGSSNRETVGGCFQSRAQ